MADDNELQMLLRLKRHEQPPPEYFETFLHEFRLRQRSELLRQPLWQLAWDRISTLLSDHSLPRYTYGMATVGVIAIAAVTSFSILSEPVSPGTSGPPLNPGEWRHLAITEGVRPEEAVIDSPAPPRLGTGGSGQRRYVIDARPVSYEPAFNF